MTGPTRPVQTSLVPELERPVGPMIESIVAGDNAALFAAIGPLYLTGSVLDVTYGRGSFYRRFQPATFEWHDLALDGVDFRQLPERDRSVDAVVFDPPYIPRDGRAPARGADMQDFRNRYGIEQPRTRREVNELIAAGVHECARVTRQWLLVKCCDYVNGRGFHSGPRVVIGAADAAGLRLHDLIVHASGVGPSSQHIAAQLRSRRAHSYLVVFAVPKRRRARDPELPPASSLQEPQREP